MSRRSCTGVIELPDATDFNLVPTIISGEQDSGWHLHGHVSLALGKDPSRGSSRSVVASVSRRFSLCLPVSLGLCLCDSPAGGDHAAVQHDPLTDRGGWHVFLAAWSRGWIGKVSCGCDRSMRWLLLGAKVPSMAFSAAPSRWAPRTPSTWRARA